MTDSELRSPAGLAAWRHAHGLSQPALARLLGVNTQTVFRWESGRVTIPRTVELALLYLETTMLPEQALPAAI